MNKEGRQSENKDAAATGRLQLWPQMYMSPLGRAQIIVPVLREQPLARRLPGTGTSFSSTRVGMIDFIVCVLSDGIGKNGLNL